MSKTYTLKVTESQFGEINSAFGCMLSHGVYCDKDTEEITAVRDDLQSQVREQGGDPYV